MEGFINKRNTFGYYSVGDVIDIKREDGTAEHNIKKINEESPQKAFDWIYRTITKKELNPKSFWKN